MIPAVLVLYGVWALFHTPSPLPDPSDLSGRWWATISEGALSARRSEPALSARRYGDQGEEAFVSYLAHELPEEYVAVSGLLVAWHLDADVIIAGPTGIWVYEVKSRRSSSSYQKAIGTVPAPVRVAGELAYLILTTDSAEVGSGPTARFSGLPVMRLPESVGASPMSSPVPSRFHPQPPTLFEFC